MLALLEKRQRLGTREGYQTSLVFCASSASEEGSGGELLAGQFLLGFPSSAALPPLLPL